MNKQQLDMRTVNSWKLTLEQVESAELAEVIAMGSLCEYGRDNIINMHRRADCFCIEPQYPTIIKISGFCH